jgi:hypothetical protein
MFVLVQHQQPALEALQSFLKEVAVASPKTKVIVPKYFQPIPLESEFSGAGRLQRDRRVEMSCGRIIFRNSCSRNTVESRPAVQLRRPTLPLTSSYLVPTELASAATSAE